MWPFYPFFKKSFILTEASQNTFSIIFYKKKKIAIRKQPKKRGLCMYALTVKEIQDILKKEHLLREVVIEDTWTNTIEQSETLQTTFYTLSYYSKEADASTLFFCKGKDFNKKYLTEAFSKGTRFYVSEKIYDEKDSVGFIVEDVRKALAVLAREFYANPQKKLKVAGITGTKGKTTTTYFLESILQFSTQQKTAVFTSIATTVDGETYEESRLTTPESLELYELMAKAVENEMTHLVMEVSSQAYKLERVYGLEFDIGVFLNISTDHIGPSEHPTFEDYLYCKRQLLLHSAQCVLYRGSDHFNLLKQDAEKSGKPFVYGDKHADSHYYIETSQTDSASFYVVANGEDTLQIEGGYSLSLPGDFNKENALSAIIVAALLGATKKQCQEGIKETSVPGRMETLTQKNGSKVYIDYAHNYISLKRLLEFVRKEHPEGKIITVLGSPGGKGLSRRKDFGKVLSSHTDIAVLTEDDPNFDDPEEIAMEIKSYMNKKKQTEIIGNRTKAIERALQLASSSADVVVLAGKGDMKYSIVKSKWIPYLGDFEVANQFINHE